MRHTFHRNSLRSKINKIPTASVIPHMPYTVHARTVLYSFVIFVLHSTPGPYWFFYGELLHMCRFTKSPLITVFFLVNFLHCNDNYFDFSPKSTRINVELRIEYRFLMHASTHKIAQNEVQMIISFIGQICYRVIRAQKSVFKWEEIGFHMEYLSALFDQ